MYAPVFSAQLPARVILLAAKAMVSGTDISVLRSLGIKSINHLFNGHESIELLKKSTAAMQTAKKTHSSPAEALLLSDPCDDMGLLDFLELLAMHSGLSSFPVVILTGSQEISKYLSPLGIQTVVRPYSAANLQEALCRALSPMRRPLSAKALQTLKEQKLTAFAWKPLEPNGKEQRNKSALAARHKRFQGTHTISDIFNYAMTAMRTGKMQEAETAFTEILAKQEDNIEAALALARIRRIQDDAKGMHRFLLHAAAAALRQGDQASVDAISALLPEHMRGALYMYEAISCMETGNYRSAALSFLDACREPNKPALHSVIARACQLTDMPEASLHKLCAAYTKLGHVSTAKKLASRLLAGADVHFERSSWLDNFPRLRDVIEVASYTTVMWKKAANE